MSFFFDRLLTNMNNNKKFEKDCFVETKDVGNIHCKSLSSSGDSDCNIVPNEGDGLTLNKPIGNNNSVTDEQKQTQPTWCGNWCLGFDT